VSPYFKKCILIFLLALSSANVMGQKIVDPCFAGINPLSFFNDSEDIVNLCGSCNDSHLGANLIEWDGEKWLGTITSYIERPPPPGCNVRALWLGYRHWNAGGEAIGLRLDKKLEANKTYSFTFTYARDGHSESSEDAAKDFSPIIYTEIVKPYSLSHAYRVGRLPPTIDWTTQLITFTASAEQAGHEWIILHGLESSGSILSGCLIGDPFTDQTDSDTTVCMGSPMELKGVYGKNYSYAWSTGDTTATIPVTESAVYSVTVRNYKCESTDSVRIQFEDCEPRMVMPNIFTPTGDEWNELFLPKEYNYIDSGNMTIFNRWGERIYMGDLFKGWDGGNSPSGIYFYEISYQDSKLNGFKKKGAVTLLR
jgi:gliding motility-associated-like protein